MTTAREAAARAAVIAALEKAVKDSKAAAYADVADLLDAGDRKGAVLPSGANIGTVSYVEGRTSAVVTNQAALLDWVKANYPHNVHSPEPVEQVMDSFLTVLKDNAVKAGVAVDTATGEEIPGMDVKTGDPYVRVSQTVDQAGAVAAAWDAGELADLVSLGAPVLKAVSA